MTNIPKSGRQKKRKRQKKVVNFTKRILINVSQLPLHLRITTTKGFINPQIFLHNMCEPLIAGLTMIIIFFLFSFSFASFFCRLWQKINFHQKHCLLFYCSGVSFFSILHLPQIFLSHSAFMSKHNHKFRSRFSIFFFIITQSKKARETLKERVKY